MLQRRKFGVQLVDPSLQLRHMVFIEQDSVQFTLALRLCDRRGHAASNVDQTTLDLANTNVSRDVSSLYGCPSMISHQSAQHVQSESDL